MINNNEDQKLLNDQVIIKKYKCKDYMIFLNSTLILFNLILNIFILYSVIQLSNNAKVLFNSSLLTNIDKIDNIIDYVCKNILPGNC